ncbi:NfeD family protein [Ketobacter sp. MCCC 1A13808]|uniref:NfeD family protein n=1 Tax=Ketobacter sp. MCCC 1A13808 TaxID=2602738 RepID=UPI000F1916D0|nr:NfeD family protein [Ketobacter sp. MCCC 1A13808]MVF10792.1 NfeD family protein [Ketobacter sp. MCCC 1A13808]RLP56205.1 MAG: NfeD family protein [Ketobacter sp.]
MELELLYWHWVVFGVVLMLGEIAITTFFILWFGVAAILMGGLLFLLPGLSVNWQIFIWTLLSAALALLWFRFLKPLSIDKTKAGMSREAIVGEVGQVISVPTKERRGRLRFPAPILGSDEWIIISQDSLAEGDRVRVKDVSGNSLVVEKMVG